MDKVQDKTGNLPVGQNYYFFLELQCIGFIWYANLKK